MKQMKPTLKQTNKNPKPQFFIMAFREKKGCRNKLNRGKNKKT
jgi:hypothetical protein